jgi:phosphatidylglycerol---prolipoprotein diacylglyceryl transferase
MTTFTWNISPVLLDFGSVQVRWYGLLFASGFLLGLQIMKKIYTLEAKDVQHLDTLMIYLVLGTVIGARLGHCLFYEPQYYLSNPLKILAVWQGGLASHGGGIGSLISLFLFTRKTETPFLWFLDRLCIPAALAGSLIRIGNFFNSEIIGTPVNLPWAVIFERIDPLPRHPVQIYEAISYFLIFVFLFFFYQKFRERFNPGILSGVLFVSVFTSRFFLEFVKTKQAVYSLGIPLNTGQLLSIPFIIAGTFLIFKAMKVLH